jgi:thioredoxin-related protein
LPPLVVEALDRAGREGRALLITFQAPWCPACRRMTRETWSDQEVADLLEQRYLVLNLNVEEHPEVARAFDVFAVPDARVLDTQGRERARFPGYRRPDQVLPLFDAASGPRARASAQPDRGTPTRSVVHD